MALHEATSYNDNRNNMQETEETSFEWKLKLLTCITNYNFP